MQKRMVETGSLEVSKLGLGCMGMSICYTLIPDKNEMINLAGKEKNTLENIYQNIMCQGY